MPVAEGQREKIAREILELTLPPSIEEGEITVRDYVEAARKDGVILSERQARIALEKGVAEGKVSLRRIGRNVFFRLIVPENETGEGRVTQSEGL